MQSIFTGTQNDAIYFFKYHYLMLIKKIHVRYHNFTKLISIITDKSPEKNASSSSETLYISCILTLLDNIFGCIF